MNIESFNPIPVICFYCSKEFSSSTIILHQKRFHPEQPKKFCPEQTQCPKCLESISITCINIHLIICTKPKNLTPVSLEELNQVISVCRFCKRKFVKERIEKHEIACEWASKKRPVFDILNKRSPFLKELKLKRNRKKVPKEVKYENSKWQKQHLQLVQSLRESSNPSYYNDYIECSYCLRKFAPKLAENHIEICKKIVNKPKPPPSITSLKNSESNKNKHPAERSSKVIIKRFSVVGLNLKASKRKLKKNCSSLIKGKNCSELSPDVLDLSEKKSLNKEGKYKKNLKFTEIKKTQSVNMKSNARLPDSDEREFKACSGCREQLPVNSKFCVICGTLNSS